MQLQVAAVRAGGIIPIRPPGTSVAASPTPDELTHLKFRTWNYPSRDSDHLSLDRPDLGFVSPLDISGVKSPLYRE
jgi:hypothetical protein